jgi:hypothetical protein
LVAASYNDNVFINSPFDPDYKPLFEAIVFAVHDCGFVPRCALEVSDAAQNRFGKILSIISECRYGIHDISRTEPDEGGLPRFNMPLELGVFLGCKAFGEDPHRRKTCLILDRESYRYQRFLSDIAGQDVKSHGSRQETAVRQVRDWLRTESRRTTIPGGASVWSRFQTFNKDLPAVCTELRIEPGELTFADLTHVISEWLKANAP